MNVLSVRSLIVPLDSTGAFDSISKLGHKAILGDYFYDVAEDVKDSYDMFGDRNSHR